MSLIQSFDQTTASLPLFEPISLALRSWRDHVIDHRHRIADLLMAVAISALLSPLVAIIALAIKLDSHGPVLLWSKRVDRDGRAILLPQFRITVQQPPRSTMMCWDAPMTRVGWLLGAAGIESTPQLVNVLSGEMTLFGGGDRPDFLNCR